MIELSVVSGTYNRLPYLQSMIRSVRNSVLRGLPYEIVLVDGGSTDGTLEWCRAQEDVVLIEHGELRGAVKAFNDGAIAAKGRYVILANDDIEFVDESILSAYAYMQDHPDVGIGCFWQDRRGWSWHVEQMPAVVNGKQTSMYYGQVCIVPKFLGDRVGWWGDYLRTYGGDNELSCNVLELGYKIAPLPCACIHDITPPDDLRKVNNTYVNGTHPDTAAWLKKWTRSGRVGPNIPANGNAVTGIPRYLRILYAPIFEKGHDIQRKTKRGLRDALAKIGNVVEVDYVAKTPGYVFDVANAFRPDLFLLQIHNAGEWTAEMLDVLRAEHPNAKFVNWNGDYHPEHLYSTDYLHMLKKFDMTGLVTTSVADVYDELRIPWFYWQIGWEVANGAPLPDTPSYDVLFIGNGYSNERQQLASFLRALPYRTGLYGFWPKSLRPNGTNLYDFDSGARLYKTAKIAIGDSQWPVAKGFVSNRLFQSLSAGAFLLHQHFDGMSELLGLEDKRHLVVWHTFDDLGDKIAYYLKHDTERERIAAEGQRFVMENHSFDRRVQELCKEIGL